MGQGETRRATMTRHDGSHNETVLLGATSGAVWGEVCVTGWTLRHDPSCRGRGASKADHPGTAARAGFFPQERHGLRRQHHSEWW